MWLFGRISYVMAFAVLVNLLSGMLFELGIEFSCLQRGSLGCSEVTLRLFGWVVLSIACAGILLISFGTYFLQLGNLGKLAVRRPLKNIFIWAVLALAIVLATIWSLSFVGDTTVTFTPENMLRGIGLMTTIAFFPGVTEELAYRWIVYDYTKRHMPKFAAAGLSGILFGIIHLNQVSSLGDGLLLMLAALAVTYLFVALYEWAGTIWAPILVHWVWDMFFLHVGVSVTTNYAPTQAVVTGAIDSAASEFLKIDYQFNSGLASGGEFGVDSSPAAIAVFLLIAFALWVRKYWRSA